MPTEFVGWDSDDSEFSEADLSIRGRHGSSGAHLRRRSVSRHRRPQDYQEYRETLYPPVPQETRVYRSASTGGRRQRDPANVTIINKQASESRNVNKPRHRVEQKFIDESDDEYPVSRSRERDHGSRRRATSNLHLNVDRAASPAQHRDYELMMNQRMLDRNDVRQDMEIWKQQQEIERLERELERHRERPRPVEAPPAPPVAPGAPLVPVVPARESRLIREEEEWYEDEISDRLRRLERYERKSRDEEQQRKNERAWRLKKLEDAEKEAHEKEELKERIKQEKIREIERQQAEEAERNKIKQQIIEDEKRRAMAAEEAKKAQLAMKAAAVEEWKIEQERKKQAEREAAARRDKEFRERLRNEFGYSEKEIENILNKKDREEKEAKEKKEKEEKEKKEKEEKEKKEKEEKERAEKDKTTWIKVCPSVLINFTIYISREDPNIHPRPGPPQTSSSRDPTRLQPPLGLGRTGQQLHHYQALGY